MQEEPCDSCDDADQQQNPVEGHRGLVGSGSGLGRSGSSYEAHVDDRNGSDDRQGDAAPLQRGDEPGDSGALDEMRERARDLGIVLDEALVRDAR